MAGRYTEPAWEDMNSWLLNMPPTDLDEILQKWLRGDFSVADFSEPSIKEENTLWEPRRTYTILEPGVALDNAHPIVHLRELGAVAEERPAQQQDDQASKLKEASTQYQQPERSVQMADILKESANEPTLRTAMELIKQLTEQISIIQKQLTEVLDCEAARAHVTDAETQRQVQEQVRNLDVAALNTRIDDIRLHEAARIIQTQPVDADATKPCEREQRVNFRDTYSLAYTDDHSTRFNPRSPPENWRQNNLNHSGRLEQTQQWTPRSHVRDVGEVIRKWGLEFSGEYNQDLEKFLTRVQECRMHAGLSDEELIPAMTVLLTGAAAAWYHNAAHRLFTWEQFCRELRASFSIDRQRQEHLEREICTRMQGANEPVWSSEEKMLDRLYANFKPALQAMIPRNQVHTIRHLSNKALDTDLILERSAMHKEAPPLDTVTFKDESYKPPNKGKVKVAGMITNTQTNPQKAPAHKQPAEENVLRELDGRIKEMLAQMKAQQQ